MLPIHSSQRPTICSRLFIKLPTADKNNDSAKYNNIKINNNCGAGWD